MVKDVKMLKEDFEEKTASEAAVGWSKYTMDAFLGCLSLRDILYN